MSTNIKVCVRVRPENEKERALGQRPVVGVVDDSLLIFDPAYEEPVSYFRGKAVKDPTSKKPREAKFAFDHVFSSSVTNIEVYEKTTKTVLRSLVDGYNCSVFAYGATGAGKTFSMLGSPQTPGVIFLSMMDLYNIKEYEKEERDIQISVSYLEVYNENIKDLLSPTGANLPIRDNGKQGIAIPGLTVKEPNSAEELLQMLEKGNKSRTQHPTDANAESSRSHAVFQVFVRVRSNTAALSNDVKVSKLSLIDLAGSERATVTKNKGARFREGANINKSLLALGNCINALADTKRKGNKHVPYRNSKLTRILKDSLGDNCKTVMLAAVSPARLSYEDTYNTLSYADRAKKIKAVVKRNVFTVSAQVQNYGKVVDDLHEEMAALKQKLKLQSVQLAEYASKELLAPAVTTPSFDIDNLQTELSQAYGERRQLRDDILHREMMQKHHMFTAMRKQQILDRLDLVSCSSYKAGTKTVSKVVRAIDAANSKFRALERSKEQEEQLLSENTAKLKELVERGHEVDNPHAQTILRLQMKAYNYEQESREWQKQNQHLMRVFNSMQESQKSHESMVQTFVQFLNSSQNLLNNYGLQSEDLSSMYSNIKQYIVNERHVSFTSGDSSVKNEEVEMVSSITQLPVLSANENSLQITGKPILHNPSAEDTVVVDANSTFTKVENGPASSECINSTFTLDDCASPSLRTTNLSSAKSSTPTRPTPSCFADLLASEPYQSSRGHSSQNNCSPQGQLCTSGDSGDKEELKLTPQKDSASSSRNYITSPYSLSIFKPVDQVLGLKHRTEITADNDSPYCPPTKLRRISMSPDTSSGISLATSSEKDRQLTNTVSLTPAGDIPDSCQSTSASPLRDVGRKLFNAAVTSTPLLAPVPRYLQTTKAAHARQTAQKENKL